MRLRASFAWAILGTIVSGLAADTVRADAPNYFNAGVDLYKAGRNSDAVDSFDQAIKHKDNATEAQGYIERIRKETVQRIRDHALTGVSKANWQTKYFFMNIVDGKVRVGISVQEMFERNSLNFRPGAIDALAQLAAAINKADTTNVDIDLINEINQDTIVDPQITSQQISAVFSYLSLSARNVLPKY